MRSGYVLRFSKKFPLSNKEQPTIAWQKAGSWRLRVEVSSKTPTIEYAFIEHPGAVVLVPLRERQGKLEVLMLRQYRRALAQTILELPAGTRGWDEDWLACAQRELREETGFRAGVFVPLGEVWPAPGVSNELMKLYLAMDLEPDPLPQDVDEEIELQPVLLSELAAMAQNGRICDAKRIIGILRTVAHLKTV